MDIYDVRFLQEAVDDLEEIVLYIAQDSQQAALRMHDQIMAKVNDLATFPKRGRFVPDRKIAEAGFRMLVVVPYIIFYRIINQTVYIYRVVHGAMNYPILYAKMLQD